MVVWLFEFQEAEASTDPADIEAADVWEALIIEIVDTIEAKIGALTASKVLSDWLRPISAMQIASGTLALRVPNQTYTRFLTSNSNVSNIIRECAAARGYTLAFEADSRP